MPGKAVVAKKCSDTGKLPILTISAKERSRHFKEFRQEIKFSYVAQTTPLLYHPYVRVGPITAEKFPGN